MRLLVALVRVRLAVARHALRDRDWARLLVALGAGALGAGAMTAEYRFLRRAFEAMAEMGVAGPPLTLYCLEAFFALILVIGVLSAVATGSAVFFRLAENRLLLAAPVSLRALFLLRGIETAVLTSWAFVLVAAPALLALGVSYHRAGGFYLAAAGLLLGFLVLGTTLGTLLTMGLGAGLGHFRSRAGIVGLTTVLLGVAAVLVGRGVVPTRADFAVMFEPGLLNGTTVAIHFVEDKFARWPSHAFAAALFGLATGGGSQPGRALALCVAWPALALAAAGWGGGALYGRLVGRATEGLVLAGGAGTAARPHGGRTFPRLLTGPIGALLEKECATLVRSPEELGRGGFLLFLLLLYTVFFLRVPVPAGGSEDVLARLAAFSLLAAGYFLTTLALRFVFPALSNEGRAVWILLASPVRLDRLVGAKLALYSLVGAVGLGGITLVGGWRLGLAGGGLAGFGGLLLVMDVTLVAVALALGICWPDFRGRPPDALATSGGGLLTVGLSLGYVALAGWAGFRLVLAHLTGAPAGRVLAPLLLTLALSVLVASGPLLAARRRLRAFEAL